MTIADNPFEVRYGMSLNYPHNLLRQFPTNNQSVINLGHPIILAVHKSLTHAI